LDWWIIFYHVNIVFNPIGNSWIGRLFWTMRTFFFNPTTIFLIGKLLRTTWTLSTRWVIFWSLNYFELSEHFWPDKQFLNRWINLNHVNIFNVTSFWIGELFWTIWTLFNQTNNFCIAKLFWSILAFFKPEEQFFISELLWTQDFF
jgi:hypothetical protein